MLGPGAVIQETGYFPSGVDEFQSRGMCLANYRVRTVVCFVERGIRAVGIAG